MASEDAENKTTHTEAAQPENKPKSKAKPRSRKAKPKAKKGTEQEESKGLQSAAPQQETPVKQEEPRVKRDEVSSTPADEPTPAEEKAVKKKAKPKGRKPKAKPKAGENAQPAAAEQTPSAGYKPEQTEGLQKTNTDAEDAAPAQAAESTKAAEVVKRPKAKKRGRPKKSAMAAAAPEQAAPEQASPRADKAESSAPARQENAEQARENEQELPQPQAAAPDQSSQAEASTTPPPEGKKKSRGKRRNRPKKSRSAKEEAKSRELQEEAAEQEMPQEASSSQPEVWEEPSEEAEVLQSAIPEPAVPVQAPPKPVVPKREPPLVIIASGNPAKIKAVELAFSRMFPDEKFDYEGMSVASGVSDQPMSDDETFAGAYMRAQACRESRPEATYWVGLEGGLEEIGDELHAFAWMVVFGPDELMGKSRTATFVLPPAVAELILVEGKELGEADDLVFGQTNSKESSGAVGILTQGILDRAQYYAQALVLALVPFKNPHLYRIEQAEAVEA